MINVSIKNLLVLGGVENLREYHVNSGTSIYFFCILGGIHTQNKSRSTPGFLGANFSCINSINIKDHGHEVINFDGINNPRDEKSLLSLKHHLPWVIDPAWLEKSERSYDRSWRGLI